MCFIETTDICLRDKYEEFNCLTDSGLLHVKVPPFKDLPHLLCTFPFRQQLAGQLVLIVADPRIGSAPHQHLHCPQLAPTALQSTGDVQGCVSTECLKCPCINFLF